MAQQGQTGLAKQGWRIRFGNGADPVECDVDGHCVIAQALAGVDTDA